MPSTDRRLELKEKTSMAQTVWQPVVYVKGLNQRWFTVFNTLWLITISHNVLCLCVVLMINTFEYKEQF